MMLRAVVRDTVLAVAICLVSACGPLRLDDTHQIRGTVVSLDGRTLGIRHKTGGTYYVQVTPGTRIVHNTPSVGSRVCPGQRATVILERTRRFTASAITLWGGDCAGTVR
jgi:hypothetical protein